GGFHLFSWVFAVPLLTMAVTIPLYGRLADIYGRKRVFFFGTTVFLIGTTLCGFSRSTEVLILCRAIQGCGSGAIQPIALTIIGDVYTPAERPGAGLDVGGVRARGGGGAGARRVSGAARPLVGGVLGQSADRGFGDRDVRPVPAGEYRAARAPARLSRRGVADPRYRRVDAGAGPGAQPRRRRGDRARRVRGREPRRADVARAAHRRADAAVSDVADQGRRAVQRGGVRRVGDDDGGVCAPADLCPGRDGAQPPRG